MSQKRVIFLAPAFKLSEPNSDGIVEIQLLKVGKFFDPRYGKFTITTKLFSELVKNFKNGSLKREVSLDYIHDGAGVSAGWLKDVFEKKDENGIDGLFANVELSGSGKTQLSQKNFKYVSAEFDPKYVDNESGELIGAVLEGAGLTNRPVIRGMKAVQLSEDDGSEEQRFFSMEEMENEFTKRNEKNKPLFELMEKEGTTQEDLINFINGKKQGAPMTDEEKKTLSEAQDSAKSLAEKNAELAKKLELSEKNSKFDKMLVKGTAVEAQRESFISGDMEKFAELSQKVSLSEKGSGGSNGGGADGDKDVEAEMAEEIKELRKKDEKLSLSEATKMVGAMDKYKSKHEQKFAL